MEMIDVLNENGAPTDEKASKDEIHKKVCGTELLIFGL